LSFEDIHARNLRRVRAGEVKAGDVDYFADIRSSKRCWDHVVWKDDCPNCRSQRREAREEKRARQATRELHREGERWEENARRPRDREDAAVRAAPETKRQGRRRR